MGNVSSRPDDGAALYLRDQARLSISSLVISNSRKRATINITPNAFPATRVVATRPLGENYPVEFIQDPEAAPGTMPNFLLKLSADDELVFTFNFIVRQPSPSSAESASGGGPDTQINGLTYVYGSSVKEVENLVTREFHADPNLHKNANVELVGDYGTGGVPSVAFEWTWKWKPPRPAEDRGGGWRNVCCFVEYDQRAHALHSLASFTFWVANPSAILSQPGSPLPLFHLNAPPKIRVASAQSVDSRISAVDQDEPNSPETLVGEPAIPSSAVSGQGGGGGAGGVIGGPGSLAKDTVKVDVSCPRPADDVSVGDDGPVFRATMKALEQKTGNMRTQMKRVLKKAENAQMALVEANEALVGFVEALKEASSTNANAVQPAIEHYFDKIAREILAYERQNAGSLQKMIIEPMARLYALDIKQAESKKRDFEEESKDYYAYVARYLGQRQDSVKSKKLAESDSKYQTKRRNFELKRFDYSSFMQDLHGGRKEQEVLSHLTRYADIQARSFLATAKRVESLLPELEALSSEVQVTDKEYQYQKREREEKRRFLEKNNKLYVEPEEPLSAPPPVGGGGSSAATGAGAGGGANGANAGSNSDSELGRADSTGSQPGTAGVRAVGVVGTLGIAGVAGGVGGGVGGGAGGAGAGSVSPSTSATTLQPGGGGGMAGVAAGGAGSGGAGASSGPTGAMSIGGGAGGLGLSSGAPGSGNTELLSRSPGSLGHGGAQHHHAPSAVGSPAQNSKFRGIRDMEERDGGNGAQRKEGLLWALNRPGGHVDPRSLNKQGWHKFWIVLDQGKLSEYSNWKQKLDLHMDPIDLRMASVREARNAERRFCFEVITPHFRRVYQATSEEDMNSWITSINNALQSAVEGRAFRDKPPTGPPSIASTGGASSVASNFKRDIGSILTGKSPSVGHGHGHGHGSHGLGSGLGSSGVPVRRTTVGGRPNPVARAASNSFEDSPDRLLQMLRDNDQGNCWCADCGSGSKVEWVSINLAIILCIECSGIHRSLGTHISKVRSLTLDITSFTPDIVELLVLVGNRVSNMVWEARMDPAVKPAPGATREQRLRFITAKYVDRAFVEPLPRPPSASSVQPAPSPDDTLVAAIKRNDVQQVIYALALRANPNAQDRSRGTHAVYLALAAADPAAPNAAAAASSTIMPVNNNNNSGTGPGASTSTVSTVVDPAAAAQVRTIPFPVAEMLLQNGAEIPAKPPQFPLSRAAQLYVEAKRGRRVAGPTTLGAAGAPSLSKTTDGATDPPPSSGNNNSNNNNSNNNNNNNNNNNINNNSNNNSNNGGSNGVTSSIAAAAAATMASIVSSSSSVLPSMLDMAGGSSAGPRLSPAERLQLQQRDRAERESSSSSTARLQKRISAGGRLAKAPIPER